MQLLCTDFIAILRWFPSFALRVPNAHDFCVISALTWARARVQNVRDFPPTKFDSEISPPFLLKEHGDHHFLFYKFNENNILNNWGKNWQKTEQAQIIFPFKDKNIN